MLAVHRAFLWLPWLVLAVWATAANGDDSLRGASLAKTQTLSPVGAPVGRAALDPMPGRKLDAQVAPAAYVAQIGPANEPLGFSAARFNPSAAPIVDPGISSGVSFGPEYENFDSIDPEGPAPAVSSGEWIRNGCWYIDVRATYIDRAANIKNDVPLSFEFVPVPIGQTPNFDLNTLAPQLNMGYEPGLSATFGRYIGRDTNNRDHSAEFTFMGLTHWNFSKSITARQPGFILLELDSQANPPVFNGSDFQSLDVTSDLNSYEVNYRVDWRLGRDRMVYSRDSTWVREASGNWICSVLAGVRTVIVNERLHWFARNALGTGNYSVTTHNNLVGPQMGAELFYDRAYWRLGVQSRAGGLVNFASQGSTVQIVDDEGEPLAPFRDVFTKNHSMSFAGGLTFMGEYRFKPNFGLKAGYDLLWVTDLALAQNQLTFFPSDPPQLSDSHSLFFHGFSLGIEWFR
jgi:hypothetical protein